MLATSDALRVFAQAPLHVYILSAFAAWTLYGVLLVVYRFTLHPLAKFPGPKLAAATKWYEFYMDIIQGQGGAYMYEIDRMHDQYGPIVRVCPDELHVRDPEWFGVLNAGPGVKRDKYPPSARMAGVTTGTFGTITQDLHRLRRTPLNPYFSKKSILESEPLIRRQVNNLCDALRRQSKTNADGVIELHQTFLAYTTDTVCSYAFDYTLNLLQNPAKALDWKKTIAAVANLTPLIKQAPWLISLVKKLPKEAVRLIIPDLTRLLDLMSEMETYAARETAKYDNSSEVEKQEKKSVDGTKRSSSIVFELLSSKLPPREKRIPRTGQECFVIIAAGGETTGRTLMNATFHLLNNPDMLKRLREEIESVMPDPDVFPEGRDIEKLPFMTAIIKETVRHWGGTASRLPLISPNEPLQYGEWLIPAGTPVGMSIRKMLYDPSTYPEPFAFKPERWLSNGPEAVLRDRHFVAFGRGNRMCLGMNLAYMELYIALTALFRRFDFELYETFKSRDIDVSRDCFLGLPHKSSPGVRVRVTRDVESKA